MSAPTTLRRGQLGTPALVFMIIAASAPLTVLAGGAPTNFAVSGLLGLPLSYLILGGVLLLFAVGYAAMSSRISNAGAFYAYISQGLGPRAGIAAALLALVSYNMLQIGLYGLFGFSLSTAILTWTSWQVPWWLCALAAWAVVALAGIRRVHMTARVLGVLVVLEFLVVIVVMGIAMVNAPEGLSTATLQPGDFLVPGVGVLLAFTIAAFLGFESGAIYSEEAKDPKRTVARATYIAVAIIAVFYALSTWAFTMGIGPGAMVEQSREHGPELVFFYLTQSSPLLAELARLLFITSVLAALVAFHNAAARYFFALGRAKVLPGVLGSLNVSGAPVGGSLAQSGTALLMIGLFAIGGVNSAFGELYPVLTLFTWFSTTPALGLVLLMAGTSVAVLFWFRKNPQGYGVFTRLIAPAVSAIALTVIAALILFNFGLMIGEESPQVMVIILPGVVLGTVIIGYLWSLRFDGDIALHEPVPALADEDQTTAQRTVSSPQPTVERVPRH